MNPLCDFCKIQLTDKEIKYGKAILFSMTCGNCWDDYQRSIKK